MSSKFEAPFSLPEGWKIVTVEELVNNRVIEKPLDGNHGGIHPKASDYVNDGVPFVMASDLENGGVNLSDCKFISEDQAKTLRKGFAKTGDVLISHKATIGRTAIVQPQKNEFIVLTPQVTYYRVKNHEALNNFYLKVYFDSKFFQNILAQWAGAGSTRAYLGITGQLKLPVIVPSIEDQRFIVESVSSLDEKIQLNRRTNQTLEQIAQTLFKSWFVDFDPVRAKVAVREHFEQRAAEQGEPVPAPAALEEAQNIAAAATIAGLSFDPADIEGTRALLEAKLAGRTAEQRAQLMETATLFPSSLEDSELGEVPVGWAASSFTDLATLDTTSVKPAAEPDTKWEHYSIPAFDEGEMPALDLGEEIKSGKYKVYENSVLVSKLNPHTPRVWAPDLANPDKAVCSTEFMQFRPKDPGQRPFVYCLIRSDYFQYGILSRVTGTTGSRQRAKPKEVAVLPVVKPSHRLIEKFSDLTGSLLHKMNASKRESKSLAESRDLLLPKLLSGEIRLNPEPLAETS